MASGTPRGGHGVGAFSGVARHGKDRRRGTRRHGARDWATEAQGSEQGTVGVSTRSDEMNRPKGLSRTISTKDQSEPGVN